MVFISVMNGDDDWVELQQMRYVVAVAEERNFTRAAQRCFVVQSALSHQIKALEQELGLTLFARTSRRVDLTTAGEAFLPAARASLEAAERAIEDAAAATGQIRGSLTIGVIPTVTAIDLPSAIGGFHRAHPEVRIALRTGGSDQFITAIAQGSMDIAVLGLPESTSVRGVQTRTLARQDLVAVFSTSHRLAHRRRIRLEDLTEETFVDFPAGTPGRTPSDDAFQTLGLVREVAFEATSTGLILDLVRNDLAIALLAPDVVTLDDRLRAVDVTNGPARIECLAWNDFNPTPAAQAFLDQIRPWSSPR